MKKYIVIIFLLLSHITVLRADTSISSTLDYVQKYMWRGFDLQNEYPAVQGCISLNLDGINSYLGLWGSYAPDKTWRAWDEIDLFAGYYMSFYQKKAYAMDMDISYTYFYFNHQPREADTNEIFLSIKYPGLIPAINTLHIIPYTGISYGASVIGNYPGAFWLNLGLNSNLTALNRTFGVKIETFYNDGAGAAGVTPGFSHIACTVNTGFHIGRTAVTPSLNYQVSIEDTVNPDNEFWFTIRLDY